MPRLPAAGAGRKPDPVIISTFPGSPRPVGGELHFSLKICFDPLSRTKE